MDPCTGLSDADIAHAIKQATGPRSPLFVPEVAFEVTTRRQIEPEPQSQPQPESEPKS